MIDMCNLYPLYPLYPCLLCMRLSKSVAVKYPGDAQTSKSSSQHPGETGNGSMEAPWQHPSVVSSVETGWKRGNCADLQSSFCQSPPKAETAETCAILQWFSPTFPKDENITLGSLWDSGCFTMFHNVSLPKRFWIQIIQDIPRHILRNCEALCFQDLLAIANTVIAGTPVLRFRGMALKQFWKFWSKYDEEMSRYAKYPQPNNVIKYKVHSIHIYLDIVIC